MSALPAAFDTTRQDVIQPDPKTIIKRGLPTRIETEAASIAFVRKHTKIPVPHVRKMWKDQCGIFSYLEMDCMPGKALSEAWPGMSPSARLATSTQFKDYLEQLRSIIQSAPTGVIGSCAHGGMFDDRLSQKAYEPVGPWKSEHDFNTYLLRNAVRHAPLSEANRFVSAMRQYRHKTVFTHGDLASDHIFVESKTGQIVGIIDWEMAAWMPEYWEYNKALLGMKYDPWWIELVKSSLGDYHAERVLDFDLEIW